MLIFADTVGIGISKMRQTVDYILVINESVNPEEAKKVEKYVQPSASYNRIAQTTRNLGNEKYIPFKLSMFENYCFRNVDVFTKPDFEKYLEGL